MIKKKIIFMCESSSKKYIKTKHFSIVSKQILICKIKLLFICYPRREAKTFYHTSYLNLYITKIIACLLD